ncbi:tetraspanin2 [Actinidia rufa]|uniref:Tetraspanin2 n=1 Tax=Actinidia rufa TaxID=165716 RepID=A0A7J0DW47_9ERIC|nr:tetraspanin2 [Actinidia rufa]
MGVSNNITAVLNFISLLCSIPIISSGVWLASKADTACVHWLRWPVVLAGVAVLLLSLAGFVGAYWNKSSLLAIYLLSMAALIVTLLILVVLAFVVSHPRRRRLRPRPQLPRVPPLRILSVAEEPHHQFGELGQN